MKCLRSQPAVLCGPRSAAASAGDDSKRATTNTHRGWRRPDAARARCLPRLGRLFGRRGSALPHQTTMHKMRPWV